jgi:hypothetical protein
VLNVAEGCYGWWHEYDKNGSIIVEKNPDGTYMIEKSLDFEGEQMRVRATDVSLQRTGKQARTTSGEGTELRFTDAKTGEKHAFEICDFTKFQKAEPGTYKTYSVNQGTYVPRSTYVLKQDSTGTYSVSKNGVKVAEGDLAEMRDGRLYVSKGGVQQIRTSPVPFAFGAFTAEKKPRFSLPDLKSLIAKERKDSPAAAGRPSRGQEAGKRER